MARLRTLWAAINATYWFYPALASLAALALAALTIHLDRSGWSEWLTGMDAIAPARPDGASNFLTVIAGSMIGVASTVFSITIAAVAYASGSYGPRLLTNFMEDKGNQFSLATFIGTFVYALAILRVVRAEHERPADVADAAASVLPGFVPQLSVLTASVLMAWVGSALLFGAIHLPTYGWNVVQALLLIGPVRLVLTLAYMKTKSIWASTIAHVLNDWTMFTAAIVISGLQA